MKDNYLKWIAIAKERIAFLMETGACYGDAAKLDQVRRIKDSIDDLNDFWNGVFSRPPNVDGGLYLLSEADRERHKELLQACMLHMGEPPNERPI